MNAVTEAVNEATMKEFKKWAEAQHPSWTVDKTDNGFEPRIGCRPVFWDKNRQSKQFPTERGAWRAFKNAKHRLMIDKANYVVGGVKV